MEEFAILYKMWLQKILRIINGIIILSASVLEGKLVGKSIKKKQVGKCRKS
jgi:hypothetical protein